MDFYRTPCWWCKLLHMVSIRFQTVLCPIQGDICKLFLQANDLDLSDFRIKSIRWRFALVHSEQSKRKLLKTLCKASGDVSWIRDLSSLRSCLLWRVQLISTVVFLKLCNYLRSEKCLNVGQQLIACFLKSYQTLVHTSKLLPGLSVL